MTAAHPTLALMPPPGPLCERITLGMPQLTATGLSESWLLKDCGDRHWRLLAAACGLDRPDFRDPAGRRVYAAFTALSLSDGALDRPAEHDTLTVAATLHRVSRTQFHSVQRISDRHGLCARVAMTSVFICRGADGGNRGIERTLLRHLPDDYGPADNRGPVAADALSAAAHRFRNGTWTEQAGFHAADRRSLARFAVDPCPGSDFNGAGLLYFASIPGFVDRAEWAWTPAPRRPASTRQRQVFFHGNADIGETLTVVLCGRRDQADGTDHWCEIIRDRDGSRLADIFTSRRPWPAV